MKDNLRSMTPVTAALLLTAFAGAGNAVEVVPTFNIPGVPPAGYPHFENDVKVSFKEARHSRDDDDDDDRGGDAAQHNHKLHKWTLEATKHGRTQLFQVDPDEAHKVQSAKFNLVSYFDEDLNFLDGSVSIEGKIKGLDVNKKTMLWEADLSHFGFDNNASDGSPKSLGWTTTDPSGWAVDAGYWTGADESVYLYEFTKGNKPSSALTEMFAEGEGEKINHLHATALTTVPVPAAVWLLGSGLLGLAGLGARAKKSRENVDGAVAA